VQDISVNAQQGSAFPQIGDDINNFVLSSGIDSPHTDMINPSAGGSHHVPLAIFPEETEKSISPDRRCWRSRKYIDFFCWSTKRIHSSLWAQMAVARLIIGETEDMTVR
jgi:hypothetical protein